jgi:hypothetical protein
VDTKKSEFIIIMLLSTFFLLQAVNVSHIEERQIIMQAISPTRQNVVSLLSFTDVYVKGDADNPYEYASDSYITLHTNLWNLGGSSRGYVEMKLFDGKLRTIMNFSKAFLAYPIFSVLGFPQIVYGHHIWGRWSPQSHELLRLPLRIYEIPPDIIIHLDYSVKSYYGTPINFVLDLWLVQNIVESGPNDGDVEIMIWFYYDKYFYPAGEYIDTISLHSNLNGVKTTLRFRVIFYDPSVYGTPLNFITVVFQIEQPLSHATIDIPIRQFLEYAIFMLKTRKYDSSYLKNLYLQAIYLGSEFKANLRNEAIAEYVINSYEIRRDNYYHVIQ